MDITLNLFDFQAEEFFATEDTSYVYTFTRTSGGNGGFIRAMVNGDPTVYTFDMVSFQFKGGSEHEIDEDRYDMEM